MSTVLKTFSLYKFLQLNYNDISIAKKAALKSLSIYQSSKNKSNHIVQSRIRSLNFILICLSAKNNEPVFKFHS